MPLLPPASPSPTWLYVLGYGTVSGTVLGALLNWVRGRRQDHVTLRVGESTEVLNFSQAIQHLYDTITRQQQRIDALQMRDEEQQAVIDQLQAELVERRDRIRFLEKRIGELEENLTSERERSLLLEREIGQLRSEKLALEARVAELTQLLAVKGIVVNDP